MNLEHRARSARKKLGWNKPWNAGREAPGKFWGGIGSGMKILKGGIDPGIMGAKRPENFGVE